MPIYYVYTLYVCTDLKGNYLYCTYKLRNIPLVLSINPIDGGYKIIAGTNSNCLVVLLPCVTKPIPKIIIPMERVLEMV